MCEMRKHDRLRWQAKRHREMHQFRIERWKEDQNNSQIGKEKAMNHNITITTTEALLINKALEMDMQNDIDNNMADLLKGKINKIVEKNLQKTNQEMIRSMGTWDLANFIKKVSNNEIEISECRGSCSDCDYTDNYCTSNIAEWLMEKVKE